MDCPLFYIDVAHSITISMHDFGDSLKPNPGEVIIDKPGKGWEFNLVPCTDLRLILVTGAFYATELHQILVNRAISHLLIIGVTTECCVTSTLKEANDRGRKSYHT